MVEKKLPASPDKVFAVLTDPKWLEARCLALGELSALCKTRKSPSVVVTMKRRVRLELSALISKVLSPESEIELEERWSAEGKGYKGQLTLQIVGKPITVKGDFELVPDGKGCIYRIQHHVKVNVPLIGGAVEKYVLGQTEQGCSEELDYLADFVKQPVGLHPATMNEPDVDFDWLVIGSGFGGSVSALRLAEKGYRVAVLECGRRYRDEDFAESTWQLGRFLWAPLLGLKGILRLAPFRDVFAASGAGVGGGSIVYANTLYRAKPAFFSNGQWGALAPWSEVLAPHYDTAERMLGVQTVPFDSAAQQLIREMARHFGTEDSFTRTPCAVFFGEPGKTVADPYFGGEGPARTGCTRCGACMVGCRVGAKNTLVKNYLWFAEKRGAQILPEHLVTDVVPLGAGDGSEGYRVTTQRPGAWFAKGRKTFTARGVVLAAGSLGTNRLLANCKHGGSLPRVSDRLGELVRTNSESILTVRLPEDRRTWNDVAISCSVHVDHDTHIEFVNYGRRADFVSLLYTVLVGRGGRVTRPLMWLGSIARHPLQWLKTLWPVGWSRRMVMLLVMQALDNAIALRARKRWFGGGYRLVTEQNRDKPNPTFIASGNAAAAWLARHTGGIAQSNVLEALGNIPTTAHLLGGAVIGADAGQGVVDQHLRVFGYRNLLVCDGAAMPANPGVNPSLTIAALAEHAMSHIAAAPGAAAGPNVSGATPVEVMA